MSFLENEEQEEDDDNNLSLPSTPNIVLDPGSGIFKVGFGGEEHPRDCFPTVVGWPKVGNEKEFFERKRNMKRLQLGERPTDIGIQLGDVAMEQKTSLTMSYPISRGYVKKWEEMELLFEYAFIDKLETDPEGAKVLVTHPPFQSMKSREEMTEILFEMFGIGGLTVMNQAMLTLYSTGRTTGLVVDTGDEVTTAVPFFDNFILTHCQNRLDLGGRDITGYMQRLLFDKGLNFSSTTEHHVIKDMKEGIGMVALDYEESMSLDPKQFQMDFSLPDGQTVTIDRERFQSAEAIFKPNLVGLAEEPGVAELAMNSFKMCEMDVRNALYGSVILAGGNSLFPGFAERLKKEMDSSEHSFKRFKVFADPMRQFSSWMGGSVIAALSTFDNFLTTLDDYNDYGASVIHTGIKNK